jgi:hypothetical protein
MECCQPTLDVIEMGWFEQRKPAAENFNGAENALLVRLKIQGRLKK